MDLKNRSVVPKAVFPSLLKTVNDNCSSSLPENIRSGFKSCGIIPLNRDPALDMLPKSQENSPEPDPTGHRKIMVTCSVAIFREIVPFKRA